MAYSYTQRKDGGFDFFDDKKRKINVNQYVQATGANKQQLVQHMASKGDKVSQSWLTNQQKLRTNANGMTQPSAPSVFQPSGQKVNTPPKANTPLKPTVPSPVDQKTQDMFRSVAEKQKRDDDNFRNTLTQRAKQNPNGRTPEQIQASIDAAVKARQSSRAAKLKAETDERNAKMFGALTAPLRAPVSFTKGAIDQSGRFVGNTADNLNITAASGLYRLTGNDYFDKKRQQFVKNQQDRNAFYDKNALTGAATKKDYDVDFAHDLGATGSRLITDVGMATVTGATAPALLHFSEAANQTQQEALEHGKSFEEAHNLGLLSGGIQAALERTGIEKLAKPFGGSAVKRAVSGAVTEGLTEGAQQFSQNLIAQNYDKERDLWDGVAKSAVMGGLMGGPVGAVNAGGMNNNTSSVDKAKNAVESTLRNADGAIDTNTVNDVAQNSPSLTERVAANRTLRELQEQSTPNFIKAAEAFDNSAEQSLIGSAGGVDFEMGSYGRNALDRKISNLDRITAEQIQESLPYIKRSYAADNNPNSLRSDNIAWVADMPNGEQRVIYTRQNSSGKEEIINAHKIGTVPNYEDRLKSFGTPAQNRTGSFGLEHLAGNPPHKSIGGERGLATSESLLDHGPSIAKNGDSVNRGADQYIRETAAQHSSPDEYRQSLIDGIWDRNKKGSGVDTWLVENPDGQGTGYSGRAAISNNSPFYQEFYAEHGYKPTKKAITEMVDAELRGEETMLSRGSEVSPHEADIYAQIKERYDATNALSDAEAKTPHKSDYRTDTPVRQTTATPNSDSRSQKTTEARGSQISKQGQQVSENPQSLETSSPAKTQSQSQPPKVDKEQQLVDSEKTSPLTTKIQQKSKVVNDTKNALRSDTEITNRMDDIDMELLKPDGGTYSMIKEQYDATNALSDTNTNPKGRGDNLARVSEQETLAGTQSGTHTNEVLSRKTGTQKQSGAGKIDSSDPSSSLVSSPSKDVELEQSNQQQGQSQKDSQRFSKRTARPQGSSFNDSISQARTPREAAGIDDVPAKNIDRTPDTPTKAKSKHASETLQNNRQVSKDTQKGLAENSPEYQVETEKQRFTESAKRRETMGDAAFTRDVRDRLDTKLGSADSQTIADAQTAAARADATGDFVTATEIYDKISEHLTKAGQTVQAAAVLARRTPEGLRYHAQKTLKKAGVELTVDRQRAITGYIDKVREAQNNLDKLHAKKGTTGADIRAAEEAVATARENVQYYLATQIPSKMADKVVNFWRAGLLTSPTTTGGAILGNAETFFTRKIWTNPAAAMSDWTMSIFTGKRTQSLAKTGEFVKGAYNDGVKGLGKQYWKTGRDAMMDGQKLGKYDQPIHKINYGQGKLGRAMGGYVNGVYSLMGAVDKPFRYGAYRESLSSQARAMIDTKRLQGNDISLADAQKMYNDFMDRPPESAVQRATDEALYETFQNKTIPGELISSLKQSAKQKGHHKTAALLDFLMPFTGVPSSIAVRVIQRTPVGTATEIVKQIINVKRGGGFDQRAMARAIGEGTAGVPLIAAGFALAGSGLLTGGYPRDEEERNEWEQTGKQPNSVKIGDRWYSLNYMQPAGTLLAIGQKMGEAKLDGDQIHEVILKGAGGGANSVVSMSFLQGLSDTLSLVSEGASESSIARWTGNTVASTVPNFIRSLARSADGKQRDTKGDSFMGTVGKSFVGAVPGARLTLPTKTDQFGQDLPAKDNFFNQFVNPLKPSRVTGADDPVVQEMTRLLATDNGVKPTEATRKTFKDHELKYSEVQEINRLSGPRIREEYKALMNSPEYADLPDEDKAKSLKAINSTVFGATKAAWGYDKGLVNEEALGDLTKDQKKYMSGEAVDFIKKTGSGGEGIEISKSIPSDSRATLEKYNDMDSDERTEWFNTQNDADYLYKKAKYDNDIAQGKLSTAGKITAQKALRKAAVGKNFSKNERDLYSLSKSDLADYLATAENGIDKQALYDRLVALDNALFDAGVIATKKLKYGLGKKGKSGSGGGSKSTGAAAAKSMASLASSVQSALAKSAKKVASTGGSGSPVKAGTMKKTVLRKTANNTSGGPRAQQYDGRKLVKSRKVA